jgi:glycosyltransferase involved in cell wall biosynthesis
MRTLVIIPAFNAAKSLKALTEGIRISAPDTDLLVVDDGSTDETAEVANSLPVSLLRHPRNQGKGVALKSGFAYALERNYDFLVTIDADLQHDPAELPRFCNAALSGHELIIGARARSRPMPLQRRLSNYLVSLLTSWVAGQKLIDAQSGFRLIPISLLRCVELKSGHYELEMELLIKAARSGFRVHSIPIDTLYTGSPSSIRPLADTIRFLLLLFRSLFW